MRDGGAIGLFAELLVGFIGWVFCLSVLTGGFFLGYLAAGYFGLEAHKESAGLLSAMSFVWIYESRKAHDRHESAKQL